MTHTGNILRGHILRMVHAGKAAHLASALSVADILVGAYWGPYQIDPSQPKDPARDVIIFSKGHAVSALYAALAERGFIPREWLKEFNVDGGCLPEQPAPGAIPGLEFAAGSLGHGLPFGVGVTLGSRRLGLGSKRVLVVMSDGECQEGSVWEAAMLAPKQDCGRLCVVIDHNHWQATGRTSEFTGLEPLAPKWAAFGWKVHEVDGHDLAALSQAYQDAYKQESQPTAIIAHTVKGKGVSFMEDDNNWHYRVPNASELARALGELGLS